MSRRAVRVIKVATLEEVGKRAAEVSRRVDLSDGKIFGTMEWLMVFVKVPLTRCQI